MKLNCDRFGDWLRKRRVQKCEKQAKWHNKFKVFVKLDHGDCRFMETVEARKIRVLSPYRLQFVENWEYRAITNTGILPP